MKTIISIIFKKYKILLMFLVIACYLPSENSFAQGFGSTSAITDITAAKNSAWKPQSKVWKHGGIWWAVIPTSSGTAGTYIYKLVDTNWEQGLLLSTLTNFQADAKNVGDITYILLFKAGTSEFVTVTYNSGTETYMKTGPTNINLSAVETATIDIDSNGRMWLAYEKSNDINVQWSDSPYDSWSGPIVLESGVDGDDICVVTAFNDADAGEKIGVMWSDQDTIGTFPTRFGFRYHNDNDDVNTWSTLEVASGSATGSVADDHINFAVAGDGTIYAAVKTSYDTNGEVQVALLIRRPNGTWDDLYSVRDREGSSREPTRPIALLDETTDIITVVYTQDVGGNDIMYKSTSTGSIDFFQGDDGFELITNDGGTDWDNVTSTKQNFNPDVVILASNTVSGTWTGVIGSNITPTPVELVYFAGNLNGNNVELRWRTETEINNYGFDIERTKDNSDWLTIGFIEGHGNSNSPKQYNFSDDDINQSGTYYYRLKQIDNDGTYEYSDVISVEVGVPNNFYLSQNYPNPFNPETRIDFTLPEKQLVSLRIYNTLGEIVEELVNEEREAGSYSVIFNASRLPSGVYIYRLQTSSFAANKKMTLLK
ncbi:MAG: T9SS type A sorting domain-containing protein [Bacteroidetes bacterium]|nr:T9SS type A sorting domain-containing protein [Bacteroidota bacterium]